MEYKPVYLVFVDENNKGTDSNKYYNAFPDETSSTFSVEYGRVGSTTSQKKTYPLSQFNKKINEKLRKGYTDVSSFMQDVINDSKIENNNNLAEEDKFNSISVESIREVIRRLYNYANNLVKSSYKISSSVVTQDQVDTAQKQIDLISSSYKDWDLKIFNNELKKLFKILPRKMRTVKQYLAENMDEEIIQKIITREQDTLDSMQSLIYKPKQNNEENNKQKDEKEKVEKTISFLDEMGIEIEETTEQEVEQIKQMMGDCANKYYCSWRVKNKEAEKKFADFIIQNNISGTKLLAHGSRNSNWFNILKMSLMIRPSNVITQGSLLGNACYFSNPKNFNGGVIKSVRYSSLNGYWSGEHEKCGFIAFFEVATGKSYDIYNFDSHYYSYNLEKLQKDCSEAWSLHLHGAGYGGSSTVTNDEITVYNCRQATIRYLVEIR